MRPTGRCATRSPTGSTARAPPGTAPPDDPFRGPACCGRPVLDAGRDGRGAGVGRAAGNLRQLRGAARTPRRSRDLRAAARTLLARHRPVAGDDCGWRKPRAGPGPGGAGGRIRTRVGDRDRRPGLGACDHARSRAGRRSDDPRRLAAAGRGVRGGSRNRCRNAPSLRRRALAGAVRISPRRPVGDRPTPRHHAARRRSGPRRNRDVPCAFDGLDPGWRQHRRRAWRDRRCRRTEPPHRPRPSGLRPDVRSGADPRPAARRGPGHGAAAARPGRLTSVAGTDSTRPTIATGHGPAIILVRPQLGENIGAAARAMLNCGLTDLRLVAPRDGWPNPQAVRAASGADLVIERARVHQSTEDAISDLRRVFATTARPRDMVKTVMTPDSAAAAMHQAQADGDRCGVLFGPERMGLENDDIALADTVIEAPLNPAYKSLNLAQAVFLVAWSWFRLGDESPGSRIELGATRPATKEELLNFFTRLEAALDECGFLRPPEKRPSMVRNIRNMFQRMQPTEQDLRTLHGIVAGLFRHRDGD
ncbi:MAG: RNA methyltransferase [Rhodospirillales bacterium]|nr:MAG: RNA methyltransferase [Rhodospirillales bacterium]